MKLEDCIQTSSSNNDSKFCDNVLANCIKSGRSPYAVHILCQTCHQKQDLLVPQGWTPAFWFNYPIIYRDTWKCTYMHIRMQVYVQLYIIDPLKKQLYKQIISHIKTCRLHGLENKCANPSKVSKYTQNI